MSDLADYYAAIVVRPDGLAPCNRLVSNTESRHRSAYSAETANDSLVIDLFELANSMANGLGRLFGHCVQADFGLPFMTSDLAVVEIGV